MRRYRSVPFPTKFEGLAQAGESLCASMEDFPVSLFSRVSVATSSNLANLIQRDISALELYIADSKLDDYNSSMVPVSEVILSNLIVEMSPYISRNNSSSSITKRFSLNIGDPDRSHMYYEGI